MAITRNGVPMYPTNFQRLTHLDRVCGELRKELGRDLKMLEIGSLLGESARILAKHGNVLCIDVWDYENGLQTFLHNTQHLNVSHIQGSSMQVLPTLKTGDYDLAYVDGEHTYPIVHSDMIQARRLVHDSGIICGDDLEKQIETEDEFDTVFRYRFKDHVGGYHPGVTAAVKETFGRVHMIDGFWWIKNEVKDNG